VLNKDFFSEHPDFIGNQLEVGDLVVFKKPRTSNSLGIGKIKHFTRTGARIQYNTINGSVDECSRKFELIVKITDTINELKETKPEMFL